MSHHSVCSKCHKPVEWLLSKLASWDWGRNEGGGSALIYVRSLLCRCNNHLRVITFLNLAVKVPDFVSLEVCTAVAESAAAVIVTLLLPVFGKEHCLIMILKDGLCTLEPVGRKICRVCTELCRKTRTLFFFRTRSCNNADIYFALHFLFSIELMASRLLHVVFLFLGCGKGNWTFMILCEVVTHSSQMRNRIWNGGF